MKCPACGTSKSLEVVDSRHYSYGIRRRRKCGACSHRWSTVEVPAGLWERLMKEEATRLIRGKGLKANEAARILGVVK